MESKIHKALKYEPDCKLVLFGALVFFQDQSRQSGLEIRIKPAIYSEPEVLPGMRHKDVHTVLDVEALQQGVVKQIITRDLALPPGRWVFPMTEVQPLKLPDRKEVALPKPGEPFVDRPEGFEKRRRRTITDNQVRKYRFQHSNECRDRFDKLLDLHEPLPKPKEPARQPELLMTRQICRKRIMSPLSLVRTRR